MKKLWILMLTLVMMLTFVGGIAMAETESYWGPYSGGLHVDYDPDMFELVDTFEENGEVSFVYRGESPIPVHMDIRCYPDRDQADVDYEVAGPFEQDGHDAIIGNNYYDAMSYFYVSDVDGVDQWRYVYILSCVNDVFVIDIYEYAGIPTEINDAINGMLDSFEFGGA